MWKCIVLLVLVAVVTTQAQSGRSARPKPPSPPSPPSRSGSSATSRSSSSRRPSGPLPRPSGPLGSVRSPPPPGGATRPSIPNTRTPSGAIGSRKRLSMRGRGKPKLTARKAPISSPRAGFPKTKCKVRCKWPNEVCVRNARCVGRACYFCAETKSIPKLPRRNQGVAIPPVNRGFGGMGMNNIGMYGIPQHRPTDIFTELFGFGPSTGGFDLFSSMESPMESPMGLPMGPPMGMGSSPLDSYMGSHMGAFGSPFGSPFGKSPGIASLFGGLFGGGSSGMNLMSMGMLGMDPFQLF